MKKITNLIAGVVLMIGATTATSLSAYCASCNSSGQNYGYSTYRYNAPGYNSYASPYSNYSNSSPYGSYGYPMPYYSSQYKMGSYKSDFRQDANRTNMNTNSNYANPANGSAPHFNPSMNSSNATPSQLWNNGNMNSQSQWNNSNANRALENTTGLKHH